MYRFPLLHRASARFALLLPVLLIACWPGDAAAHVKWFAPYDVPGQPRLLSDVFDASFWETAFAALLAFVLTAYLERGPVGWGTLAALDRVTRWFRPRIDDLYRAGTAAFFVSLWTIGGIILTPELKT